MYEGMGSMKENVSILPFTHEDGGKTESFRAKNATTPLVIDCSQMK
jgi:hypothetical protein